METKSRQEKPQEPERRLTFQWPAETRAKACGMYIIQDTPNLDIISDTLGVPVSTLRYWYTKDDWKSKREAAFSALMQSTYETAMAEINNRRRQTLEEIDAARSVAMDGLNDPDLEFKDKKQAADVLRDSHRLLKDIYDTEEPKILLADIGKIILEIVKDEDERRQIGEALLAKEKEWRSR